jgi:CBS domain-containing protein
MLAPSKAVLDLTAADVMTGDLVCLSQDTPLRAAARVLSRNQITGAPVVDHQGKCVGVLSAGDFLCLAGSSTSEARHSGQPVTCRFLRKHPGGVGRAAAVCSLPGGVCPLQTAGIGPSGEEVMSCSQPHCVLVEWQVLEKELFPDDVVHHHMTTNLVTAFLHTRVAELARMMVDARVHRVIIVDEDDRPIGLVSGTDVLVALTRLGRSAGVPTLRPGSEPWRTTNELPLDS